MAGTPQRDRRRGGGDQCQVPDEVNGGDGGVERADAALRAPWRRGGSHWRLEMGRVREDRAVLYVQIECGFVMPA